ncbi:MAG: hypothetical protein RL118_190 [Actinomycetota bacterium]
MKRLPSSRALERQRKLSTMQEFSAIFGLIASGATIASLLGLIYQQFQSRREHTAQTRPFINLACEIRNIDNRPMIVLKINNSGQLPARGLRFEAENGAKLFDLSGSVKIPFAPNSPDLDVFPGQKLVYLLGPATGPSALPLANRESILVQVTYGSHVRRKPYREVARLSIASNSFLVEASF